jgi:hypothetical protein
LSLSRDGNWCERPSLHGDPELGEAAAVCTADYNNGKPYFDAAMLGGLFSIRWPVEIVKGPDGRFKIKTPPGVDIPMSLTMPS